MINQFRSHGQKHASSSARNSSGASPHISLVEPMLQQAIKRHQQNKLTEARKLYEQILSHNPTHADATHLLGVLKHQSAEHDSAVSLIEQALVWKPDSILYRKNLMSAYYSAGKIEQAEQTCQEVLRSEPDEPVTLSLLAKIYEGQQQWIKAIPVLGQALKAEKDFAEKQKLLIRLGDSFARAGEHQKSAECFRELIVASPKSLIAHHNLAREYHAMKQIEKAVEHYRIALQLDPCCASAWNNLGVIYQAEAQFTQARECLEKARQLNPALPDVYNNLANVMESLGELSSCRKNLERAIELRPNYAEALYSLGLMDLRDGNLSVGWERYEWRLKKQENDHRNFSFPEWTGEKNHDLSLLIFSEQGIGDIAMFATCLREAIDLVKQVTLEVDSRMVSLFQRSFPDVLVIPRISDQDHAANPQRLSGIDQQISIAKLPALFRRDFSQFPRHELIFQPDSGLREKWRQRYAQLGTGLKIGISWFGGKNRELQFRRAIPLEQWEPILKTEGVHFVNLQYGAAAEDRWEVERSCQVPIHDWPDANPLLDLDDFAAKLSELDLIISIDNSTVHFAGCLGVPTWCMLSTVADWRWGNILEKSIWYDSLKLIRQEQYGNWKTVIADVSLRLKNLSLKYQQEKPGQPELISDSFGISASMTSTPKIAVKQKPKCAVISPVGPGHADLYEQTKESIRLACEQGAGAFQEIIPFRVDDPQGKIGAFRSRNEAVKQAAARGIEWVFFLDADDLLVPQVFLHVEPLLENYDAIWGEIYTFQDGTNLAARLDGQVSATESFADLIQTDPRLSLRMGHFVRTEVALQNPFDIESKTAADFDYYLRIWKKYRCLKLNQPLFASRQGRHSSGQCSVSQADWRSAVEQLFEKERRELIRASSVFEAKSDAQHSPHAEKPQVAALSQPEDLIRYWKQDRLANIIPRNRNLGEFPEGFDVRSFLKERLLSYSPEKILELGCGYGRLCQAFPPEKYLGLDINSEAIQVAQTMNPGYQFATIPFESEYPQSDILLAYTLLLHVDDLSIGSLVRHMCQASPTIVIAEILGRDRWRRAGNPPVFNRDVEDYQLLLQDCGYKLSDVIEKPYAHYPGTNISFLTFRSQQTI